MSEEGKSLEFRLENVNQTRNCAIEEINRNELSSQLNRIFQLH